MVMKETTLLLFLLTGVWVQAGATTYKIDPEHSTVAFHIHHLIGKVTGHFDRFQGTVDYEAGKPASWKTSATIEAASINTQSAKRDTHLRSEDFFEVEKYPTLTFKSTGVTDVQGNHAKLHGDLTMHGVTKPVVLDLEVGGLAKDPWGGTHAAFSATGKLDRRDYGVEWNQAVEGGGLLIGNEVELELDIEGILQK
jgi:polyisoprenoid-binding protein YceI